MQGYIEKGFAEKVRIDTDSQSSELSWFLPHQPVINPKKPLKLRIVFDCGAEIIGKSLSKSLVQGPDLVNLLTGVLTRFRKEQVSCSSF